MFRDSITMTSEHPIIYQVFRTLIIYWLFIAILVRGSNIIFGNSVLLREQLIRNLHISVHIGS